MARALYLAASSLLLIAGPPLVLLASLVRPAWRRGLAQRLTLRRPALPAGPIWIHGASIGEVRVATELGKRLSAAFPGRPLLVTTNTVAGAEEAARAGHAAWFAPVDHPLTAARFLDAASPAILVVVETELWPFWLSALEQRGIPAVLVNGRISRRALGRYRWAARLFRRTLQGFSLLLMRGAEDAEHARALGADPGRVVVAGDMKGALAPGVPAARVGALRERYGIREDDPVLVAGSTDAGEEEIVLDAWDAARVGSPNLRLILAPRQPARFDDAWRLAAARTPLVRRASEEEGVRAAPAILLDRMGELADHYGLADLAFVGGSFTDRGGQNLLEPARLGVPVLYGPHVENWEAAARRIEAAGGGRRCGSPGELSDAVAALLADGARRRAMGAAAMGAAAEEGAEDAVALAVRSIGRLLGGPGGP